MLNYLKTTCFLFLFLSLNLLAAQTESKDNLTLISPKKLQEDFQLLKTGLEKTHAGLYTYTPKDTLDKALSTIELSLNQPMTSIDFYRKITPLLKLIGNGHTNFLVPPDYNKVINTTAPRFPFAVYWHQDTLYILRNLSEEETLKPGTIIKSINGESVANIIANLADNLTRDGYNTSLPIGKIMHDFSGIYTLFKGTPATFDLKIIDKNGSNKTVVINGLTTEKIIKYAKKRHPNWRKPKGLPLQFSIENDIGRLTINSFYKPSIRTAKQSYKSFFKTVFQQIEKEKLAHLIIDIRDNGGGWPEVVNELFSYLINAPYTNKTEAYTITKNLPNQKYYQNGFWEFMDMRKSFKLKKEGAIFRITGGEQNKLIQPAKNKFKGKLYVLTNPFTFSAAAEFLGMLKNIDRGIFIGEVAGGSPHRTTAWIMPSLILPNTKIEAILPLAHSITKNNFPDDGLGIPPDFFVKNSIADVLAKRDLVLEFTLKKIQNDQD